MTDNETIKALQICSDDEADTCRDCPYSNDWTICNELLAKDALDLINRQQAEIERLNACVKTEDEVRAIAKETIQQYILTARAEAVKEFAERLKKKSQKRTSDIYGERVYMQDIDILVKEMVGDR